MGLFNLDQFEEISLKIPRVEDYFDFPSSLIAFGESLGSSYLLNYEDIVYFRVRNNYATLVTYFCESKFLRELIEDMKKKGWNIKSLNFVNKDMKEFKTKFYMNEFFIDEDYNQETIYEGLKRKSRYNIQRELKIAKEKFEIISSMSKPKFSYSDIIILFNNWVTFAKERHFMVMKGHYLKYIKRFYEKQNNVTFLYFVRKSDNLLFGVSGFEYFQGKVQLTIMKHMGGDYSFPRFFWLETINYILNTFHPEKVFCGSTADTLKEVLKFKKERSFKLEI